MIHWEWLIGTALLSFVLGHWLATTLLFTNRFVLRLTPDARQKLMVLMARADVHSYTDVLRLALATLERDLEERS